jgi:ribose transport system substrate-binding protein
MVGRSRSLVALAVVGMLVGACSTSAAPTASPVAPSGSTPVAPSGSTGASAAKTSGLIVVLMPSSTNTYLAQWEVGAKDKAKKLGYDIKIIENNFDQAEQDSQVTQELTSGDKPVGYIWWPADQKAGLASLQKLDGTGLPIVQTNQLPLAGTEKDWTAYAGVDDLTNGKVAADLLVKEMTKAGKFPNIDGGIISRFPIGYSAGDFRDQGLETGLKAAGAQYTILATDPAGFQETDGYKSASQLIPANKSKGLLWAYGNNDALAGGIVKAAKESGLTPGKDIFIVGGTCHGDLSSVESGALVGTAIQSAYLEGWLSVQTMFKIVQNGGKVQDGNSPDSASLSTSTPPSDSGMAYKYNFMPNPPVANNAAAIDATSLWGWTMRFLCNY